MPDVRFGSKAAPQKVMSALPPKADINRHSNGHLPSNPKPRMTDTVSARHYLNFRFIQLSVCSFFVHRIDRPLVMPRRPLVIPRKTGASSTATYGLQLSVDRPRGR